MIEWVNVFDHFANNVYLEPDEKRIVYSFLKNEESKY